MLRVASNPPCTCPAADIDAFEALVLEGSEVDPNGLSQRISRAQRLAFTFSDQDLVGVAALKHPNIKYRKSVFVKSNSSRSPAAFPLELGWVYVKRDYRDRGISRLLVQELVRGIGEKNVFATSWTDNSAMHRSLEGFGFIREGKPYTSDIRTEKLQLFVRVTAEQAPAGKTILCR